jgi:hypothetical protein
MRKFSLGMSYDRFGYLISAVVFITTRRIHAPNCCSGSGAVDSLN